MRSLTRIEEDSEDKVKSADDVEEQSAQLPPAIAPLSESLVSKSVFLSTSISTEWELL